MSNSTFVNIYFFSYKTNYVSNDFHEGFKSSLEDASAISIS